MPLSDADVQQLELVFSRYLTGSPGAPLPALSEFLAAAPPAGVYAVGHVPAFVHINFQFLPKEKTIKLDFARRKNQSDLKAWYLADQGVHKSPWTDREKALLEGLARPPKILESGIVCPRIVAFATCRFPDPTPENPKAHRLIGGVPLQMDIVDFSFSGLDPRNVDVDWAAAYKSYVNGSKIAEDAQVNSYANIYFTATEIGSRNPQWVERAHAFWDHELSIANKQDMMQLAINHFPHDSKWEPQWVAYAWTRSFESTPASHVERGWITQAGIDYASGKSVRDA